MLQYREPTQACTADVHKHSMQLNELALCKSMACGLHSPLSKQGSPQAVRRAARSLERDEARGVGGSDAGLAVLHGLVADRELCQVVAHHVGLDLDLGATHTAPGIVSPLLLLAGACQPLLGWLWPSWHSPTPVHAKSNTLLLLLLTTITPINPFCKNGSP